MHKWNLEGKLRKAIHHGLLLVTVYILAFFTNSPDTDLWARLAVGSIFFQTGQVLRHDIFSYLPTKNLWVDHEWGSGVIFYYFAKYLGEYGIFVLKGLLVYLIFVMVHKAINVRQRSPHTTSKASPAARLPVAVAYFMLLGYALFPGIASLVRSQMFSYLFFIIWIYELECIRLSWHKTLWMFPYTMLFWANMHGGFVAGIGLVLLYAIGELLNRKKILPYVWILLLILPVTLINPYGFSLWSYIVEASLMPRPLIPEWQPISLSGPMQSIGGLHVHILTGYMLFVVMTAAAACQSIAQKKKANWTKIILVAVLFFLSVRHQRHTVFFLLAVSALLYDEFNGLLDPLRRIVAQTFPRHCSKIQTGAGWSFGFVLPAIVFVCIIPRLPHQVITSYKKYPVGSMEFIRQNGISGNLATAFNWGSYVLWKLYPQCKVMVDGRYEEVYPNDVFETAMHFSERQDHWWEVLTRFHTDVVVLPKLVYTREDLSHLPDWKPVYQDFVSVVLVPRDNVPRSYLRPDYQGPAYSIDNLAKPISLAPSE
jgi:hypothetical protein